MDRCVLAVFVAVVLLAATDLVTDVRQGTTLGHTATEAAILLFGLAGAFVVARRLLSTLRCARVTAQRARSLAGQLEAAAADAAR